MEITLIVKDSKNKLTIFDVNAQATLFNFISYLQNTYTTFDFSKIHTYQFGKITLTKEDLDKKLSELFQREGVIELSLSYVSSQNTSSNLSAAILTEHYNELSKAKSLLQKTDTQRLKFIHASSFAMLPSPYLFEAEMDNCSNQYLVVDIDITKEPQGIPCIEQPEGFGQQYANCLNLALKHSINPDGSIQIQLDKDNLTNYSQNNARSFKIAKETCGQPSFSGHTVKYLKNYKIIIEYNYELSVIGVYAPQYQSSNKDDVNLLFTPVSNFSLNKTDLNRPYSAVKATITQFIVQNVVPYIPESLPKDLHLILHPYAYNLARDFLLLILAQGSKVVWNQSHTLDEIINACVKQWHYADSTRKAVLLMLEKDEQWLNKQSHESLKDALLATASQLAHAWVLSTPYKINHFIEQKAPELTHNKSTKHIDDVLKEAVSKAIVTYKLKYLQIYPQGKIISEANQLDTAILKTKKPVNILKLFLTFGRLSNKMDITLFNKGRIERQVHYLMKEIANEVIKIKEIPADLKSKVTELYASSPKQKLSY